MLLQPKIQTVGGISDFVSGDYNIKQELKVINKKLNSKGLKAALTTFAGVTAIQLTGFSAKAHAHMVEAVPVAAQVANGYVETQVKEQIIRAFDPLIALVQALSYPITALILTGGCLMILINQKEKGYTMIQNAAIGYILVQMSPLLLKLLVGVGGAAVGIIPIF